MIKSIGLGGSVVSKNILEHRGNIKWCIREAPVNELDNGWRILSDIDTDEFLENASNMIICDWSTIIELEPAVLNIYDMPQGTDITLMSKDGIKFWVYTDTEELVKF